MTDLRPDSSGDPRTADLGYARVDVDRADRTGDPEVVYGGIGVTLTLAARNVALVVLLVLTVVALVRPLPI